MQAGARVRIFGLTKAAQHNEKIAKVKGRAGQDGRIGVELEDGQVLSVRPSNLEVVVAQEPFVPASSTASASAGSEEKNQRTLTRDNAVLEEFNSSRDPDTLVLYYHLRDRAFDCYNAPEYNSQMLRYYAAGITVVAVVPRRIRENSYQLVCMRNKEPDANSLCELAFQCQRQFIGASVLMKQSCFVCNRPNAPLCACHCACFCTGCEAEAAGREHKKLCKMIRSASIAGKDEEALQLV
jgi:hypothetical protein